MLFKYGNVVSGKYFYDRKKMQKKVEAKILKGQSLMLKAPRRYGKTSLIKNVMIENGIDYLYTDFRKTPRLELLNDKLVEYLYSNMGIKGALAKIKDNAFAFARENRTTIKVNVEFFEASVELFSNSSLSQEQRLLDVLDAIDSLAKEIDKTLYIFMDEFQDIGKLSVDGDILEMMRSVMQHHENVCYVFAGSNMTLMTEIFENKKSAFFNFCRKMNLEAFDNKELSVELIEAFKSIEAVFENDDILNEVLIKLKGHPANTMMVMENLETIVEDNNTPFVIKEDHISEAFDDALEEMADLISEFLKEIKTKEHLHDVIYRMANNEEQVLSAASLLQKRNYLIDMGYIHKVALGNYSIIDGFLEEELKKT